MHPLCHEWRVVIPIIRIPWCFIASTNGIHSVLLHLLLPKDLGQDRTKLEDCVSEKKRERCKLMS